MYIRQRKVRNAPSTEADVAQIIHMTPKTVLGVITVLKRTGKHYIEASAEALFPSRETEFAFDGCTGGMSVCTLV